jgi:hypothetical protein
MFGFVVALLAFVLDIVALRLDSVVVLRLDGVVVLRLDVVVVLRLDVVVALLGVTLGVPPLRPLWPL